MKTEQSITIREIRPEEYQSLGQLMVEVILHTTQTMQTAWRLYTSLGSERSEDLDLMQENLSVFDFRLNLT